MQSAEEPQFAAVFAQEATETHVPKANTIDDNRNIVWNLGRSLLLGLQLAAILYNRFRAKMLPDLKVLDKLQEDYNYLKISKITQPKNVFARNT